MRPRHWFGIAALLGSLASVPDATAQGAGVEIIDQGPCPTVPPTPEYLLEWSWAEGTQAEALNTARAEARRKLEATLCRGVSEARCAAATRHIAPHGEGHWEERKRGRGAACAGVAVERRFLDQLDRDMEAFDRQLTALALQVWDAVDSRPLRLEAPRWASGCGAGPLGATLMATLASRLAGTHLAESGNLDTLSLTLAPGATRLTISASLRQAGQAHATALGGFEVPLDLFQVTPDEVGTCYADTRLERRTGANGISVRVHTGVSDGVACEGSQVPLSISSSASARAWLFSLLPDGQAFLIWPSMAGGALLDGEQSLGTIDVSRTPGGGDELLVAVAVPASETWAPAMSWHGPCRMSAPLESWGWPPGAALDTATYTVLAPGVAACPVGGAAFNPTALEEAMRSLPMCSGS
jgi:hypothetical protein